MWFVCLAAEASIDGAATEQVRDDDVKILICVSGMPYAATTLKFGNLVAGLRPSQVSLLKVVERKTDETAASAMLQQAQRLLSAPVESIKVRQGKSAPEIIRETCAAQCYDMVVMGASQASGLAQLFWRSSAEKVADRAPISVLVVKEERPSLQKILVCVGGQKSNPAVVEWGVKLAQASGAHVQILYISDPMPGMYVGLDEMDESLSELLQSGTPIAQYLRWSARFLAESGVTAAMKIRYGRAVDEIRLEAEEGDYDLLVIGARAEMPLLNELLMDKVTPQILASPPCSTLVVRGQAETPVTRK